MLMCMDANWDVFCLIADNNGITNVKIYEHFGIAQSDASRRVKELKSHGLLEVEMDGHFCKYSVTEKSLRVAKSIKKWSQR